MFITIALFLQIFFFSKKTLIPESSLLKTNAGPSFILLYLVSIFLKFSFIWKEADEKLVNVTLFHGNKARRTIFSDKKVLKKHIFHSGTKTDIDLDFLMIQQLQLLLYQMWIVLFIRVTFFLAMPAPKSWIWKKKWGGKEIFSFIFS